MKNFSPKNIAIVIVVILIIVAIIYFLGKKAGKKTTPQEVELPSDIQPNEITSFNPGPYTDAIFQDVNELFGFRDAEPYNQALGLSNTQLVAVYNDWNQRYLNKVGKTMTKAIQDETTLWNYSFISAAKTLIDRLKNLKLQ
jgi:hypothetical protein